MKVILRAVGGLAAAVLLLVLLPFFGSDSSSASTGAGICTVDDAGISNAGTIAGYSGEQLHNALAIMNAASALGLGARGQQIGVMTAMGESSLRVLTHGDSAGPDSRGLFQQRDSWGTLEQRLDPAESARLFFQRLAGVDGWATMEPTLAAHAVQINADPNHYTSHWDDAVAVVYALTSIGSCTTGVIGAEGWGMPALDAVNSSYGPRAPVCTPVGCTSDFHDGADFDGECGDPIWSAAAGIVTRVFQDNKGGWIIEVDHGGGVTAWYVHMYADGIFVAQGDQVSPGQQIGEQGMSGYATGCHLHFEVHVNGTVVDPLAFLAARGVQGAEG